MTTARRKRDDGGPPWIVGLAEVVEAVAALPVDVQTELALGALPDDGGCRACKALRSHISAPVHDSAANRLQYWHEELCRHRPGHGHEQDATRAGAIYGVAAALAYGRAEGWDLIVPVKPERACPATHDSEEDSR